MGERAARSHDMKRHRSLIPLSHDHHNGLVVAQCLLLGRSKAPRSTWPTSRREQVDRVLEFFRTDLRRHFEAEEEHLFPAAERRLRNGVDLVRQLREEHDDMRARILEFERDPENGLEDRLPAFGERLQAHIRTEEQILFERVQEEMDPGVLEAVGVALRAACYQAGCPTSDTPHTLPRPERLSE